ncbi:hypothetical protein ACLOJK_039353 [Asimina triloba]
MIHWKAAGDEPDGAIVRAVSDSLMDLERVIPGSCEVLVSSLLQRLGSSKESSIKGLQEMAAHIFTESSAQLGAENANLAIANRNKQPNADLSESPNSSPLAKFLIARSGEKVSILCYWLLKYSKLKPIINTLGCIGGVIHADGRAKFLEISTQFSSSIIAGKQIETTPLPLYSTGGTVSTPPGETKPNSHQVQVSFLAVEANAGGMVFSSNPLALSVPDPAFESWLRDKGYLEILDERTSAIYSSSSSSNTTTTTTSAASPSSSSPSTSGPPAAGFCRAIIAAAAASLNTFASLLTLNPFAKLTADDFSAETPSWTVGFFGVVDSYSWPAGPSQARMRVQENVKRYAHNYACLGLIFCACSLFIPNANCTSGVGSKPGLVSLPFSCPLYYSFFVSFSPPLENFLVLLDASQPEQMDLEDFRETSRAPGFQSCLSQTHLNMPTVVAQMPSPAKKDYLEIYPNNSISPAPSHLQVKLPSFFQREHQAHSSVLPKRVTGQRQNWVVLLLLFLKSSRQRGIAISRLDNKRRAYKTGCQRVVDPESLEGAWTLLHDRKISVLTVKFLTWFRKLSLEMINKLWIFEAEESYSHPLYLRATNFGYSAELIQVHLGQRTGNFKGRGTEPKAKNPCV